MQLTLFPTDKRTPYQRHYDKFYKGVKERYARESLSRKKKLTETINLSKYFKK